MKFIVTKSRKYKLMINGIKDRVVSKSQERVNLTETDLRLSSTRRYKLKDKRLRLRSKGEVFPEVESSLYRLMAGGSTARQEDGVTTISQAEKPKEP